MANDTGFASLWEHKINLMSQQPSWYHSVTQKEVFVPPTEPKGAILADDVRILLPRLSKHIQNFFYLDGSRQDNHLCLSHGCNIRLFICICLLETGHCSAAATTARGSQCSSFRGLCVGYARNLGRKFFDVRQSKSKGGEGPGETGSRICQVISDQG